MKNAYYCSSSAAKETFSMVNHLIRECHVGNSFCGEIKALEKLVFLKMYFFNIQTKIT